MVFVLQVQWLKTRGWGAIRWWNQENPIPPWGATVLGPWLLRMSLCQGHGAGELARNDSPWKNLTLWQSRSGLWRNLCLGDVATWHFFQGKFFGKEPAMEGASILFHILFQYKMLQVFCWTSEARKGWTWRFRRGFGFLSISLMPLAVSWWNFQTEHDWTIGPDMRPRTPKFLGKQLQSFQQVLHGFFSRHRRTVLCTEFWTGCMKQSC